MKHKVFDHYERYEMRKNEDEFKILSSTDSLGRSFGPVDFNLSWLDGFLRVRYAPFQAKQQCFTKNNSHRFHFFAESPEISNNILRERDYTKTFLLVIGILFIQLVYNFLSLKYSQINLGSQWYHIVLKNAGNHRNFHLLTRYDQGFDFKVCYTSEDLRTETSNEMCPKPRSFRSY